MKYLCIRGREQLLDSFLPPEICRSRLDEVILQVKLLELGSCAAFLGRLLDPPDPRAIQLSLQLLETINAVRLTPATEELTPLGFHLAQLPLDPQTGIYWNGAEYF
jgi:ATP-dependent RNA helicase DHX36